MFDWNSLLKFGIGTLAGSGLLYWLFKTLGARFIDHFTFHQGLTKWTLMERYRRGSISFRP